MGYKLKFSNLKNIYLELKNNYTSDDKYLAVITNNGLWIKDEINNEIFIINSSTKLKNEFLNDVFISKFDKNFNLVENIFSKKVDIKTNLWIVEKPIYFRDNKQIQSDDKKPEFIIIYHFRNCITFNRK